ncbi:MAG: glycosyltransferase [Methanomassiliicoccales archaeon]|jgi:dolichol-phosphate mannosyltransferase|nr:glycosyltransferase [Methanomassiliicoccales archaeon]MDD1756981.1 glycosyltransferase [Methanomassiliicoccales archaeon]
MGEVQGEIDHGLFTIVIPTLNEVGNVRNMVEELFHLYPGVSITVVDDGSKDGTVESIQAMMHNRLGLNLIQRNPAERGLTGSVVDGIKSVKTMGFVVMDCDFQHPPAKARDLMKEIQHGAKLVVAVREGMEPLSLSRKIGSGGAHRLASTYLWFKRRSSTKDTMSGFFAMRTDLAKDIIAVNEERFEKRGFKVLFDLLRFAPRGTVVVESSYKFGDRASGQSKLSSDVALSVLRQCGLGGKVASGTLHFFLINKAGRAVGFIILAAIFVIVISLAA